MTQNGSERPFSPICVHSFAPPRPLARPSRCNSVHKWQKTVSRGHSHRSVYTPAFPCLSTTAQQCTQMIQNGSERPFSPICVHSFAPPRPLARPSRCNSVHKWQKTVSRGHSHRSVYTPAFPCLSTTAQQCTQMIQNGSERPFSPICVHSLHLNDRSRDRAGLRVPRRRRPHGPRDARALGPDAHAARAVTQLPTYTSSRSLVITNPYHEAL